MKALNARIKLRNVPARTVGVMRSSGGWSQASYDENLAKAAVNLKTEGGATFLRCNSPMMPAFWRRIEIWLGLV